MAAISVIITVLNEEKTLNSLFKGLESQTHLPSEVIIVDGGSSDRTQKILNSWKPKFKYKWFVTEGNRSKGRNAAISAASHDLIAITDAGCRPDKDWLFELLSTQVLTKAQVIAGYYKSDARTTFEQAATAYMLVMPNQIDPDNFLPATRSMLISKKVWQKVGKFPEKFSHNEDYVFAKRLQRANVKMAFSERALVHWSPPTNWEAFLKQVSRFAYGDIEAGIVRPKVISIFIRWLILFFFLTAGFGMFVVFIALYCYWAYRKNREYVKGPQAARILPQMQIATDFAIMFASTKAWIRKNL